MRKYFFAGTKYKIIKIRIIWRNLFHQILKFKILNFAILSVAKNGELVSNIFHQEKGDKMSGGKPHFEKMTKVDIPEMNIHEQFMDNSQDHDAIRTVQKRMVIDKRIINDDNDK